MYTQPSAFRSQLLLLSEAKPSVSPKEHGHPPCWPDPSPCQLPLALKVPWVLPVMSNHPSPGRQPAALWLLCPLQPWLLSLSSSPDCQIL